MGDQGAADLQRKLDRLREGTLSPQARGLSKSTSMEIQTSEIDAICHECQQQFRTSATTFDGKTLHATVCADCSAKGDVDTSAPVDSMERLAALGFNVKKHGSVAIDDLGIRSALPFADRLLGLKKWQSMDSIFMHGTTGTGKTQAMFSIARYLIESGYKGRIVFDRARAFITTVQDAYGGGKVDAVIESRRNAGIWLFDDAGCEKLTPDAFRIVEDILDARDGHPMVWTSNYDPDELCQRWAATADVQRFRSRLSTFRVVEVAGVDRRFAT